MQIYLDIVYLVHIIMIQYILRYIYQDTENLIKFAIL